MNTTARRPLAAPTTSSSPLQPINFHHSTVKPNRWDYGMLRHLVAALDGTTVALSIDQLHAYSGARLDGFADTRSTHGLLITTGYASVDGEVVEQGTVWNPRRLDPMIVPLENGQARWTALSSYSEECTSAVDIARQQPAMAYVNDYARWVRYEATPGEYEVHVAAYDAQDRRSTARTLAHTTVSLADALALTVERITPRLEHYPHLQVTLDACTRAAQR